MIPIGTKVQIAAKLDVLPGWPGRKPGIRGRVVSCWNRADGTTYLVSHDGGDVAARYFHDELTPYRERATEAAAPGPEQVRLGDLEARVEHAEKRLDGQAISDDRLEKAHDRLEAQVNKLVGQADGMRDVFARELAGLQNQLEHYWDRLRVLEQQSPRHPEPVHDDVTLDARPSELSALRELRRAVEQWWSTPHPGNAPDLFPGKLTAAVDDALVTLIELDDDGPPDEIPEEPAPPPSDAYGEIEQLQEELAQARADIGLLRSQRDDAISRNARALETLRDVFDLRPDCTLITDAADDAAKQLGQLKAEIDALTGGELAAQIEPVRDFIAQLGRDGMSKAEDGLELLSRYSQLSFSELQEVLQLLAGKGNEDPDCPAAVLAELCELLLRAEPEPGNTPPQSPR